MATTHGDILNDMVADTIKAAYDYAYKYDIEPREVYELLSDLVDSNWKATHPCGSVSIDAPAARVESAV